VTSGTAASGVVSVEELFAGVGSGPFAASSAMVAVFVIYVVPGGTGASTITA
jgi:hypothetical protein